MDTAEIHTRVCEAQNRLSYVAWANVYIYNGQIQTSPHSEQHKKELERVRDSLNTILVSTD